MSRPTLDPALHVQISPTGLSPSPAGLSSAIPLSVHVNSAVLTPTCSHVGLGSAGFARRYSRNRCFFLFLRLLRCFSSPGSPPCTMDSCMDHTIARMRSPYSDISGSWLICSSPELFAAYHVFRRLLVPRHPPCALFCLISFLILDA